MPDFVHERLGIAARERWDEISANRIGLLAEIAVPLSVKSLNWRSSLVPSGPVTSTKLLNLIENPRLKSPSFERMRCVKALIALMVSGAGEHPTALLHSTFGPPQI